MFVIAFLFTSIGWFSMNSFNSPSQLCFKYTMYFNGMVCLFMLAITIYTVFTFAEMGDSFAIAFEKANTQFYTEPLAALAWQLIQQAFECCEFTKISRKAQDVVPSTCCALPMDYQRPATTCFVADIVYETPCNRTVFNWGPKVINFVWFHMVLIVSASCTGFCVSRSLRPDI